MEKRLRSSLQSSAEEFLSSATKLGFKSIKPSLKTLISNISPSSDLSSSLPLALHQSITHSIESFKQSLEPNSGDADSIPSPSSPPSKRPRRSTRKRTEPNNATTEEEETNLTSNKVNLNRIISHLQNLQVYTHIVFLCISHSKDPFSPLDLLPSVQALHGSMLSFQLDESMRSFASYSDSLLTEIANLCEEWWKEELPEKETIISQAFPYLLSKSLTSLKKGDVRRVYALREAFALFDYDDEDTEDLKLLLVRCIISPVYLKVEEGRRFIAFLFGLNMQLVKEALAMIRTQIPFGRKSMLEAFADILFRAWKVAEGPVKDEIENKFLQGLVDVAVHARTASLAASVRRILAEFITRRTTCGVEKLLFRLTEPVLFRSLQVANSNVRQNALLLLLDVFPLEDPNSTKEDKDVLLERQFFLLDRLLQDECPDIRVVAVEGSCRILHMFWEIIPSPNVAKTITKICDEMSLDICSEVRVSTLNGIIYLLGNLQTHEILKVLLPRLKHLFTDPVFSVRVAFMNLLLALRDIRTFEFHKVVGLEVILASLANEEPLVAQKITSLLIPSFFPSKVTLEEACKRCIAFIKRSPLAGGRFCEFALTEGSSPESLMELVTILSGSLSKPSDNLSSDQIEGFLDAALNLCKSLVSKASYRADLNKLFSGELLKQLFTSVHTQHAQTTVLKIASVVSPDQTTFLIKECMDLINNFVGSSDVEKQAQIRSAHKLMISTNRFDEMFGSLTNLLQITASGCHAKFGVELPEQNMPNVKQKKPKLSRKSSVKSKSAQGKKIASFHNTDSFQQHYVVAAGAAWQIKDLLTSADSRDAIVKSPLLEVVFVALKTISAVSIEHCMCYEYLDTSPVFAYANLALHMALKNVDLAETDRKDGLDSTRSSLKGTVLNCSLDHLFSCMDRLFASRNSEKASNLPFKSKHNEENKTQGQKLKNVQIDDCCPLDGSTFPDQKRIFNMVKMITAVLKFVVDAITLCPLSHSHQRLLQFALSYVTVINATLRKHSQELLQLNEGDLKEILLCVKSSYTYAAKLLNLVLKNTAESSLPLLEAFDLSNDLLNLIMSIESCFGSRRVSSLVATVKPWLPDIILALGSCHIFTGGPSERDHLTATLGKPCLPWLNVLGKLELCKLSEPDQDDKSNSTSASNEFPVFRKVMEIIVLVLRRNLKVLDSVGIIFLNGLSDLLGREDYGLFFGLLHFLCVELVHEHGEWDELPAMLASLRELYPQIEKGLEDSRICDDGKQMLGTAKELLDPVWMAYIFEDAGGSEREEE